VFKLSGRKKDKGTGGMAETENGPTEKFEHRIPTGGAKLLRGQQDKQDCGGTHWQRRRA